jgi:hypothetical protein
MFQRFFVVALAALAPTVSAATFDVTTIADSGAGSLRQALIDANTALSPPHTVRFAPSFPLFGSISLLSDLPSLSNGALIVDGNSRSPQLNGQDLYALFRANAGLTRLELGGLRLTRGLRTSGGCVALLIADQPTALTVSNSSFRDCRARAGGSPRGGAIDWLAGSAAVTISQSIFINNSAGGSAANQSGTGGAISASGLIAIDASEFSDNQIDVGSAITGGTGGALALTAVADGVIAIRGSRFSRNSATPLATDPLGLGGALRFSCAASCEVTVEGNYFRDNLARRGAALSGPGSFGGGSKRVNLINNTFFANDASSSGGALAALGGQFAIEHNTFVENGALSGGHLERESGVWQRFANNVLTATSSGSACVGVAAVTGATGNLFEQSCGTLSGALTPASALGRLPLDESQRVGVIRFVFGSAVIDSASLSACADVDARGTARPIDSDGNGVAGCDPGAYEHPLDDRIFRDGFQW